MSIWVCGEVLIDVLPTGPVVGGGPANTAKALARLGQTVDFIGGISTDAFGMIARKELSRDGVGLGLSLESDKPTCTATVNLDKAGGATYTFVIDGTATFDFSPSWLPDPERLKPSVLHIGTLATVVEPGAAVLFDWAVKCAEFAPIAFDPNVRPSFLGDREKYCQAVENGLVFHLWSSFPMRTLLGYILINHWMKWHIAGLKESHHLLLLHGVPKGSSAIPEVLAKRLKVCE
jgi:fructokinase